MEQSLEFDILISEYHSYTAMLQERGLDSVSKNDTELKAMSLHDLRVLVRHLKDVARTPSV